MTIDDTNEIDGDWRRLTTIDDTSKAIDDTNEIDGDWRQETTIDDDCEIDGNWRHERDRRRLTTTAIDGDLWGDLWDDLG